MGCMNCNDMVGGCVVCNPGAFPSAASAGYGHLQSELIRIAACLLQLVPSDMVDDYPQKTYSVGRVARMMKRPNETAKMLAYQLRQLADSIKP